MSIQSKRSSEHNRIRDDRQKYISDSFYLEYNAPKRDEKGGNEGISMVKINISIEGEDVAEIIDELLHVGIELLKANRKELREALKILADETLDVMLEKKTLERGAELYKKINTEINWTYKRDKP
jgi:hypothetical protein